MATRRDFLKQVGLGAAVIAAGPIGLTRGAKPAARHPNVVLIMTDDQGWGDVTAHGNEKLKTPNMDLLAKQGAWFDRFYVSPVCAPTRASLMTGRYHPRTGVHGVTRGQENMRLEEVTLADVFKQAGYATGCFGKWHNGRHYPYHPNGRGFDEFYGFCAGHWNNYFNTGLDHNGKDVKSSGFIIDDLTDKAISFIGANRAKPFLCYVPFNTPHTPWQVPDKYWDRVKKRLTDHDTSVCAYAMCENIDDNIGRILKTLDDLKLTNDTIVIFLSDNGPNTGRWNGEMKGRKGSTDEGGVRVPFFLRWPGHVKPRKIEQIASHIDVLPTLAELAGIDKPKTCPLDGVSLVPLIEGETRDWPERMIFSAWNGRVSVRTQQYRANAQALYDMTSDPHQKKNIAADKPEVHAKLAAACVKWAADVGLKNRKTCPIPIGHPERPVVTMPGHEAMLVSSKNVPEPKPAQGKKKKKRRRVSRGISYNKGAGWANDWVDNWTELDAHPYWPVDVVNAGQYEVTLMYACAADDVGAKFRVECGTGSVDGQITKAHDPKFIESPDRIARKEVYEKVWAPLKVGKITLSKGVNKLIVRAISKPGQQVMELKAVRLERIK
ncbi:MAG: arylsulfatase [Phycisphaerales bacterium]|jgi:arylsulfatase A-like enzyme|nr:arylsulfatase [Phycisphaerales bacterium]